MSLKISACLVVYHEEKLIERCLKSLLGAVDETIVVHDGVCQDKTLEIAKNHQAKIFVRPHTGAYEAHFPFAVKQAGGEWILHIDADEFLSEELRLRLGSLVEDRGVDAYAFRWPLYDGKKYIRGSYESGVKTVLFRKSKLYHLGIVHEEPQTYGNLVKRRDLLLEHRPSYDNFTFQKLFNKWFKWSDIQAKEIVNLEKVATFNIKDRYLNPRYKYYLEFRKAPVFFTFKHLVKNSVFLFKKGLWLSSPKNWKIFWFFVLNDFYLALRIKYYQKSRAQL